MRELRSKRRELQMTSRQVCPYPFGPVEGLTLNAMYAKVRAEQALVRVQMPYGEDGWLATRHDDVRTVLSDPRFSRAATLTPDLPRAEPEAPDPEVAATNITNMDAPEHGRLRSLIAAAFSTRRMEAIQPFVEATTQALVDDMLTADAPVNLVEAFSEPLPVIVICELLGVPYEDRSQFRSGIEAALSNPSVPADERVTAIQGISDYVADLIGKRRTRADGPGDDLIGVLVSARDADGTRLTEAELVMLVITLLAAGHETTLNMISNMAFTLLEERSRWNYVVANPDRVPDVVEELLRYIPTNTHSGQTRVALEDVTLSGGTVRAGEAVIVGIVPGNRDPEKYDDPEMLRLDRAPHDILTFGHGPHRCVGPTLARMELQIALRALVTRVPTLDLAGDVEWRTSTLLRGPRRLPVRW